MLCSELPSRGEIASIEMREQGVPHGLSGQRGISVRAQSLGTFQEYHH